MVCCVELLLMFGKHLWTEALVGVPVSSPEEHRSELSADAPQIWIHQELNKETWIYLSSRCHKLWQQLSVVLMVWFCCGSQFIHHGQQVLPFAAAGVFRMLLFICKLSNDPGQFCSRSLVLRGEEEKHVRGARIKVWTRMSWRDSVVIN